MTDTTTTAWKQQWADLDDPERQALLRGEPLPRAVPNRVVRDVSHEADRVFEEVRRAGHGIPVQAINAGREFAWTDRAIAELVRRGLLRRVTVTVRDRNPLAAIGTPPEEIPVDGVEIVPGFERAGLMPPVSRRTGERPTATR